MQRTATRNGKLSFNKPASKTLKEEDLSKGVESVLLLPLEYFFFTSVSTLLL